MRKVLVLVLAMILVIAMAGFAFAGISASAHDLVSGPFAAGTTLTLGTGTTQLCVFCHHPHRGVSATSPDALLWNMDDFSLASYPTYAQSGSINATDPGTAADITAPQTYLCMACHDGSIGTGALVTKPYDGTDITGGPYNLSAEAALGATLEDDHPVNFTYPTADNNIQAVMVGTWVDGAVSTNNYPLFSSKMQCATCHDVHAGLTDSQSSSSNLDFMRGDIVGSEICLDCHLNK